MPILWLEAGGAWFNPGEAVGPLGGTSDAAPSDAADGPGGASAGQQPHPSSRALMPVEPTVERVAYQEVDFPKWKVGNPHRLIQLALGRLLDGKTGHPLSSKPPWAVQFRSWGL